MKEEGRVSPAPLLECIGNCLFWFRLFSERFCKLTGLILAIILPRPVREQSYGFSPAEKGQVKNHKIVLRTYPK